MQNEERQLSPVPALDTLFRVIPLEFLYALIKNEQRIYVYKFQHILLYM